MNFHPITTPASPPLASSFFDAAFDSIESVTTSFATSSLPILETTTVTEVALGYHPNGKYSITAITTSTRAVTERYAYTAYGQPKICNASGSPIGNQQSQIADRFTYTGREWDETLGLHHFRARWMSQLAIRFMGRDPIGYDGSKWGLYDFLCGRLLKKLNPTGLIQIECTCRGYAPGDTSSGHYIDTKVTDCIGLAQNCCAHACKDGSFTGEWKIANAEPENLGLDEEIIDITEDVVCSFFLVSEVVVPTPGEGLACAAGTRVVCRKVKECFLMKGKSPGPPQKPPGSPP